MCRELRHCSSRAESNAWVLLLAEKFLKRGDGPPCEGVKTVHSGFESSLSCSSVLAPELRVVRQPASQRLLGYATLRGSLRDAVLGEQRQDGPLAHGGGLAPMTALLPDFCGRLRSPAGPPATRHILDRTGSVHQRR